MWFYTTTIDILLLCALYDSLGTEGFKAAANVLTRNQKLHQFVTRSKEVAQNYEAQNYEDLGGCMVRIGDALEQLSEQLST